MIFLVDFLNGFNQMNHNVFQFVIAVGNDEIIKSGNIAF